jgi:hypothetical protein
MQGINWVNAQFLWYHGALPVQLMSDDRIRLLAKIKQFGKIANRRAVLYLIDRQNMSDFIFDGENQGQMQDVVPTLYSPNWGIAANLVRRHVKDAGNHLLN